MTSEHKDERPAAVWMHLAFVLTGLGTLLLGPILPLLSRQWHLTDAQSGLLFSAQFYGSFAGGMTVSKRLRRSMALGMLAAGVGFGVFAGAGSLGVACAGLFVGGYGLGQLITSINIAAGRRYTARRGSALAFLNFSWSFGAMLSPTLAGWLAPRYPLRVLLGWFAAAFLVMLPALLLQLRGGPAEIVEAREEVAGTGLRGTVFVYFCALLVVYGGLETCLGGWLTTYAVRYGRGSLGWGASATVLLLAGLTIGRAGSSLAMLRVGEGRLLWASLTVAAGLTAALALARTAGVMAAIAVLLGLSLAPFFPAAFSLLMAERPTARQAGVVLAVSALGAAALPWAMGVVSTKTGSLQVALALPLGAAVTLLGLSMLPIEARKQDAGLRA